MRRKQAVRARWGLLLAVYWSVLIPTALTVLTSQENLVLLLALLAIGVPLYVVAANAILDRYEAVAANPGDGTAHDQSDSNVTPFRPRARLPSSTEASAPMEGPGRLRKLG